LCHITTSIRQINFTYNGDGTRVKKVVGSAATYYIGNWYEVTNGTATKYYYFGSQRVAMKNASGVTYLHGDHLGSTSVTSGAQPGTQTYYPYGGVRSGSLPTDYTFTGQKRDNEAGLLYYGARYYDSAIGRFIQADTIISDGYNPQDWNRYTYTRNNPLRYTDPSGRICVPCVIGVLIVAAKVIDYGWTVYDTVDSMQVLNDPGSSNLDRSLAQLNIGLALITEAAEPDDVSPVSLPADDVARRGLIAAARDAIVKGDYSLLNKLPDDLKWMKDVIRGMATEIKVLDELGIKKNTLTIKGLVDGQSVDTIPDILNHTEKVIGEIKDVKKLSATEQILAQIAWAQKEGYTYKLYINKETELTGTLTDLRNNGSIIVEYIDDILQ